MVSVPYHYQKMLNGGMYKKREWDVLPTLNKTNNPKIFIEAVNNMKNEKEPSQFQRMKDAYLSRKNNPERRLPEDMSDEEHLRYMNNRSEGIKKERKNKMH